jgi:hypothetical protein
MNSHMRTYIEDLAALLADQVGMLEQEAHAEGADAFVLACLHGAARRLRRVSGQETSRGAWHVRR